MSTTINAQNALQIRERPMDVYIGFQTGSTSTISAYNPTSQYKTYDATLNETAWNMRPIADLAGDGFPLDGTCEWYDTTITASANNGKIGLRGVVNNNVVVSISSSLTITSITIATSGADTIIYDGTSYPATGLNVIPVNSSSATLTITPAETNGRIEINYIVPGIILDIDNSNLISCTLALRGNLDVIDHTWEESDIEVKIYYPYSIADSFAYVQNDWPITYRAGYDSDLSDLRKFYLSEPIEQVDNVITIKGVDASHWLDEKTLDERFFNIYRGNYRYDSHYALYQRFVNVIESAGITIVKKDPDISAHETGTLDRSVLPEMSARDFVAGIMNFTLNSKYENGLNSKWWGIQFVDAGIPTVEIGNGLMFGREWYINKSEIGDVEYRNEQHIAKISNTNSDHKFAETLTRSTQTLAYILNHPFIEFETQSVNQLVDLSFDGYYNPITTANYDIIKMIPSGMVFKFKGAVGSHALQGWGHSISGGVNTYSNPDGLPGTTFETEPFIHGNLLDYNGNPVIDYSSIFERSNRTISFTWKGDPRMQPLDWIIITDDTDPDEPTTAYRISSIELTHESGGTIAKISAREWARPKPI